MAIVKGDLTPIFGSSLVRIDASHNDLLKYVSLNEKLINAINEIGKLSFQSRHQQHCRQEFGISCEKILHSDNVLYLAWEYDKSVLFRPKNLKQNKNFLIIKNGSNKYYKFSEKDQSQILGILRIGRKQLYLFDNNMIPYEGNFVCLLDFYVHYSFQRRGIGNRLFDFMMENERIEMAYQIGFDNPSVALLRFLHKKYNLDDPIWQNTNFVVFSQLFSVAENLALENDSEPPEGWRRSTTPRSINTNLKANGARFLENAISGHPAARKARLRQSENPHTTQINSNSTARSNTPLLIIDRNTNASQMQNEARLRKQHVLSSKPLW